MVLGNPAHIRSAGFPRMLNPLSYLVSEKRRFAIVVSQGHNNRLLSSELSSVPMPTFYFRNKFNIAFVPEFCKRSSYCF